MKPQGVWAELLRTRFRIAAKRLGMNEEKFQTLDCTQFRRPSLSGQLTLL